MRPSSWLTVLMAAATTCANAATPPADGDLVEEIVVYGVSPGEAARRRADEVARHVQTASASMLAEAQSIDLTGFMARHLASVSLNSAQNNPLQPDLQFRGYTASPLLGLPQGLAVYQDGARLNEPLGDAVNWDLVPESAVHRIDLIGGADPLFGLNSLGGAITLEMKHGFNFEGHQAELLAGSHDRTVWSLESGGNDGRFGYYVNLSRFDEDGWRDASPSDARNAYVSLGWRGEASSADLGLTAGDSDLTGNGAAPVGLIDRERNAIFTAPDITGNDAVLLTLEGRHELRKGVHVFGNAFYRQNDTRSFNGDASEFLVCRLGGSERLLEGVEEDDLEDAGLELETLCDGRFPDAATLTAFLATRIDEDAPHVEDLTETLSGSGALSGEAINNRSRRQQESHGFDVGIETSGRLFGTRHQLLVGARHYRGDADFRARVELARLDPLTRSTAGLGLGTFVGNESTEVTTVTESWTVYALDTLTLTDVLHLTLAGRLDRTEVHIRDESGRRPEVEGDHEFDQFSPSVGLTWQASEHVPIENLSFYASYAESSRAPTPIELTCNETVFERARQRAAADGDDPEDVDFECRLPNAFVADPPLEMVVAHSVELGARGTAGTVDWHLGLFRQTNHDDIVFQTTGRATGLFGSIERTRRQGLETTLHGAWNDVSWSLAYTWLDATFEDDFTVQSPAHPAADAAGRLAVAAGDRIPGIPEHQLKAGLSWQASRRLSAGVSLMHFAGTHLRGDEANLLDTTDAYTVLDLRGSFQVNEHLTAFGRVSNVLDQRYENFGLIAEDPTEVIPDLVDARPVFLAPGPPRAAWVGLRLEL